MTPSKSKTIWRLTAQFFTNSIAGGIIGLTCGVISMALGINYNYETAAIRGIFVGIIIGVTLSTIIFRKLNIEHYKNYALTLIAITVALFSIAIGAQYLPSAEISGLSILAPIMSILIAFSAVPSLLVVLGTYLYERKR